MPRQTRTASWRESWVCANLRSVTKAGKIYRVRIPGSVQHRFGRDRWAKAFVDPVSARSWIAERQAEIAQALAGAERDEQIGPALVSIHMADAVAMWLRQRKPDVSQKTYTGYEELSRHLGVEMGRLQVGKVSRSAIHDHFERRRAAGASGSNLRRDLWLIQCVLRWAMERGHRVDQTAFIVKRPRSVPTLTRRYDPDAVERLLSVATPRQRAILLVAAWTGMRRAELRAFSISWILWREGRIEVPHDLAYETKSKKPRSIPLDDVLHQELEAWLGKRKTGLVFPPIIKRSRYGANKGPDVRGIFRRCRDLAGVDLRGVHDLRHHYLSALSAMGMTAAEIQPIAGHSSLRMTDHYTHASPNYLGRAREALNRGKLGSKPGTLAKKQGRRKASGS